MDPIIVEDPGWEKWFREFEKWVELIMEVIKLVRQRVVSGL